VLIDCLTLLPFGQSGTSPGPFPDRGGELGDVLARPGDASVVDHDVETAEFVPDALCRGCDMLNLLEKGAENQSLVIV